MFLVIDIGNSHTVTGMFEGEKLVGQWRLRSDRLSTADELAFRYQTLFAMSSFSLGDIDSIIIASVVPTLEAAWIACSEKYFGARLGDNLLLVKSDTVDDLITIKLANPLEVGADRLVNGIAAWERYQSKLVVIDFGTAITFDCVTEKCEYLGGAILPGIAISLDALASKTAQLPHIDISTGQGTFIGRSTVEAMRSGVLHGYGAMIDGMTAGIRREMADREMDQVQIIATGGMAQLIAPYTRSIAEIDPLLTLHGLAIIHRHLCQR